MEHARISQVPALDHAILIAAFAGWNDAASAATWAIKFLINHWEATAFAEIEPDDFYDFSATRPQVRITNGAIRRLTWPANRFYVHRTDRSSGQPGQCHVEDVVLLGALVAEVPHTAPVHVRGAASTAPLLRRMERSSVERANYEGVTGI